jgi:hypothetical protein
MYSFRKPKLPLIVHFTYEKILGEKKMKKYSSLICILILCKDSLLLGRHAAGPHANMWGAASTQLLEGDERPQESASKLLEVSTYGLLGCSSKIKKQCELVGKTLHGLTVYKFNSSNSDLDSMISGISKYLRKCFPVGGLPLGLVPWKSCKTIPLQYYFTCAGLDPITLDALHYYRLTCSPPPPTLPHPSMPQQNLNSQPEQSQSHDEST